MLLKGGYGWEAGRRAASGYGAFILAGTFVVVVVFMVLLSRLFCRILIQLRYYEAMLVVSLLEGMAYVSSLLKLPFFDIGPMIQAIDHNNSIDPASIGYSQLWYGTLAPYFLPVTLSLSGAFAYLYSQTPH